MRCARCTVRSSAAKLAVSEHRPDWTHKARLVLSPSSGGGQTDQADPTSEFPPPGRDCRRPHPKDGTTPTCAAPRRNNIAKSPASEPNAAMYTMASRAAWSRPSGMDAHPVLGGRRSWPHRAKHRRTDASTCETAKSSAHVELHPRVIRDAQSPKCCGIASLCHGRAILEPTARSGPLGPEKRRLPKSQRFRRIRMERAQKSKL